MNTLMRTIKLKLQISPSKIIPTIHAYTCSYNFVCKTGFDNNITNGVELHKQTYNICRTNFNLPSQLAVSSRMKATESLKSIHTTKKKGKNASCPISNQCSIRYDDRSYNVNFTKNTISILTINGRLIIPITIPNYFKQYINWKRKSAELFIKENSVFINIVMESAIEIPNISNKIIGIDRGIKNPLVLSNHIFYKGGKYNQIKNKYRKLKSALQSNGSRSAQRHLAKLKSKENRFQRNTNHVIAKEVVNMFEPGDTLVFEKLTGIRHARHRHNQNRDFHTWSFYQLEQFIKYKAEGNGIKVEYVSARYTSQKCSKCGHTEKSNRKYLSVFKCKHCGYSLNADLNASFNIRNNFLDTISYPERAAVNQHIVHPLNKPLHLCKGS